MLVAIPLMVGLALFTWFVLGKCFPPGKDPLRLERRREKLLVGVPAALVILAGGGGVLRFWALVKSRRLSRVQPFCANREDGGHDRRA